MAFRVEAYPEAGQPGFAVLRRDADDDDFELQVYEECGFFNATRFCVLSGRDYEDYARQPRSRDLDASLGPKFGYCLSLSPEKLELEHTSPAAGTYVHLFKLLDVACWLSNELYVKCALAAGHFFLGSPARPEQLRVTLKIGDEEAPVDAVVDERRKIRRVGYAGAEFLADEDGLVNASKLRGPDGPRVALDGCADAGHVSDALRRYLGELQPVRCERGSGDSPAPADGTYVHPLVAVRALLWLGAAEYARLANVIFSVFWKLDAALAAAAEKHETETFAAGSSGAKDRPTHGDW